MDDPLPPLPPPMLLAIAHAPSDVRDRLRWLLQFDRRLGQLVERASEPLFAQMRLAWWRDILAKSAADRPRGEPLLALLHALGDDPVLLDAARQLVDAAELGAADDEAKARADRAMAIGKAYAAWTGADRKQAESLALAWAGPDVEPGNAALTSYPRIFRPLTILAMSEQLETDAVRTAGLRLSWHALTGR